MVFHAVESSDLVQDGLKLKDSALENLNTIFLSLSEVSLRYSDLFSPSLLTPGGVGW